MDFHMKLPRGKRDSRSAVFHVWLRNFAIALGVELLVAEPVARFVMHKRHQRTDAKSGQ